MIDQTALRPSHSDGPSGGGRANAPLPASLDAAVEAHRERLVRFRRLLHATPEASNQERATTARVAEVLREAGLKPRVMADDVGVSVDLDLGAPADSLIALRSELDCVQVNDDKQVPYASTRPGLCHACGHDAHTAILLGATLVLHEHLDRIRRLELRHNLRMIFQPAEETSTGARSMIQQGAIDGVEAIIALHVDPHIPAGVLGFRKGPITAACKSFRVQIRGRSGHSARPHEAVDPIPAATTLVDQFYQLGPRSMDSRFPLALTVASIAAGNSYNAIPDEAVITGTLRAARTMDLEAVHQRMSAVCRGVEESTGCHVALDFPHYAPATDNDPAIVDTLAEVAGDVLGPDGVRWLDVASLGAEDFAFYQELIPGVMVRLGAALPEGRQRPLHSSLFDIDEVALPVGTRFFARSAVALAAGDHWNRV